MTVLLYNYQPPKLIDWLSATATTDLPVDRPELVSLRTLTPIPPLDRMVSNTVTPDRLS